MSYYEKEAAAFKVTKLHAIKAEGEESEERRRRTEINKPTQRREYPDRRRSGCELAGS